MALEIVGLTYDGTDLVDWPSGIFAEIVEGIGSVPVVRGEDTTIPEAAGTLEGNRVNDHLPIELRVQVRAQEDEVGLAQRASYFDNLLAVRTLFATNRTRADLVAVLPNGTTLTISAAPRNIIPAEVYPGEYAELSIRLDGDGDWLVS